MADLSLVPDPAWREAQRRTAIQDDRSEAATRVLADWQAPIDSDWRAWSWSRREAWRVTGKNRSSLLGWKTANACGRE